MNPKRGIMPTRVVFCAPKQVELGPPDITGLTADRIDLPGEPYMARYFLQGDAIAVDGSIRYHNLLTRCGGSDATGFRTHKSAHPDAF